MTRGRNNWAQNKTEDSGIHNHVRPFPSMHLKRWHSRCTTVTAVLNAVFAYLDNIRGESSIKPNPVTCRNHTDACHTAEDRHAYPPPVITKVTRMNLSTKHCQDQRQDRQQVHLAPKLQHGSAIDLISGWGKTKSNHFILRRNHLIPLHRSCRIHKGQHVNEIAATVTSTLNLYTYSITVESIENTRHITAQNANRDACIVQGEPTAACLLWSVAGEQVITHWAQHAHLR